MQRAEFRKSSSLFLRKWASRLRDSGDVCDGDRKEYTDVRARACVIGDPRAVLRNAFPKRTVYLHCRVIGFVMLCKIMKYVDYVVGVTKMGYED